MSSLLLADAETRADLATFMSRARVLDEEGAVRLLSAGRALATYVCAVPGSGLMGDGTVLGLRVFALAPASAGAGDVDVTVPIAAMSDRLHRGTDPSDAEGSLAIELPPVTLTPRWAALTPPRTEWSGQGERPAQAVSSVAAQGIQEVTEGAPSGSGASAVMTLRERVWARPAEGLAEAPAGLAFAAQALGFVVEPDEMITIHRSGRWWRLTTRRGHTLARA